MSKGKEREGGTRRYFFHSKTTKLQITEKFSSMLSCSKQLTLKSLKYIDSYLNFLT